MTEQLPNPFETLACLPTPSGGAFYYSLPALERAGFSRLRTLPVCLRLVLESLLRHFDDNVIRLSDIERLANYQADNPGPHSIPFKVARVLLQDFTGVPLLVDLAAMRDAVLACGKNPLLVEPQVPVDLVVDHSVQVDCSSIPEAFSRNLRKEYQRNKERYAFLKWGQQAFKTLKVVPSGLGIVHQVNLEHFARMLFVEKKDKGTTLLYPDSLVGTDSHTTMINGLGIVAWGVGGIEAEAALLGQPISFRMPEVVGLHLKGTLPEGSTATDLALRVTELLRQSNVVGKFVEFLGEGVSSLPVADRATLANMAPEYGATLGFFPIDEQTLAYLKLTDRAPELINLARSYFKAQGLFGLPDKEQVKYSQLLELNLSSINSSLAGPKRPQDCLSLKDLPSRFTELLSTSAEAGGYALSPKQLSKKAEVHMQVARATGPLPCHFSLKHGDVLIAAITSCTNTSNPHVMLGAALLAKRALAAGLSVPLFVKCSLAPGSRVVSDYLKAAALQPYLDALGFHLVGYGCTTCIGNSGPLHPSLEAALKAEGIVAASVLSGNRNFEARVHPSILANFLASPPLVVAYALAGNVRKNLREEPLGLGKGDKPVYLKDIWPSNMEVANTVERFVKAPLFAARYKSQQSTKEWDNIVPPSGSTYLWDRQSTYIREPPFFKAFQIKAPRLPTIRHARALAILGDSITTDHISPAGSIAVDSPAGLYLRKQGVDPSDLNSYGSRRGNDEVMTRGTFANVRLRNILALPKQGGYTTLDTGELVNIYQAASYYREQKVPLVVFAREDYGMGSSRDWAAKGTYLLGVRVVVARSFERIHRSNLIGMGVLPLCFQGETDAATLRLDGTQTFSFPLPSDELTPLGETVMELRREGGEVERVPLTVRLDTDMEKACYLEGGILPSLLRDLIKSP